MEAQHKDKLLFVAEYSELSTTLTTNLFNLEIGSIKVELSEIEWFFFHF